MFPISFETEKNIFKYLVVRELISKTITILNYNLTVCLHTCCFVKEKAKFNYWYSKQNPESLSCTARGLGVIIKENN